VTERKRRKLEWVCLRGVVREGVPGNAGLCRERDRERERERLGESVCVIGKSVPENGGVYSKSVFERRRDTERVCLKSEVYEERVRV